MENLTEKRFKTYSYSGTEEYYFYSTILNSWIYVKNDVYKGQIRIIDAVKIKMPEHLIQCEINSLIESNAVFHEQKLFDRSKTFQNLLAKYSRDKYSYPLSKFTDENYLKEQLINQYGFEYEIKKLQTQIEEQRKEIEYKEKTIINYKLFGTNDFKQIEKIKIQNAKIQAKQEKQFQKEKALKIKEKEKQLKLELKKGNKFVAICRNWTGSKKHLKFQGETIEFRTSKPTTRNWYELRTETIKEVAEKLISI